MSGRLATGLERETPSGARKLDALEENYDAQFRVVFDAIRELTTPPESPKKRIGFEKDEEQSLSLAKVPAFERRSAIGVTM